MFRKCEPSRQYIQLPINKIGTFFIDDPVSLFKHTLLGVFIIKALNIFFSWIFSEFIKCRLG